MKVKARYFTTLRGLAQRAEEEIEFEDNITLADPIEKIALKYGCEARQYLYSDEKRRKVDSSVRFLINGRDARMLRGLETKLENVDIMAIIPPIGGGAK